MKMNQFKNLLFITLTTIFIAISCKKNDTPIDNNTTDAILPAKTNNIKKKEAIKFSYNKPSNGQVISWNVTPSENVWVSKVGNDAFFKFNKKGTYIIYARRGSESADSTEVTVNDSTSTTPQDTTLPGGGFPADSLNICNNYINIDLNINTNTTVFDTILADSGAVIKIIDVNVQADLANGCQSFSNVQVQSNTNFNHNITLKGKEMSCPNFVCTQALIPISQRTRISNVLAGTHTVNFIKNGSVLFSRQVVVR